MIRLALVFLGFLYLLLPMQAQVTDPNPLEIYPFNGKYIRLNNLETFELEELPARSFKTQSIYATRFKGMAIDKLAFRGKLFELRPDNGIMFTDLSLGASKALINREKGFERFGQHFLVEAADGLVCVKYLNSEHGFMIYKYDAAGNELFGLQLLHSDWIEKPNLRYQRPFLKYFAHTPLQMVFTSYVADKPQTYVVDLTSGQVQSYDFLIHGIIRDEKTDAMINGFVVLDAAKGRIGLNYQNSSFELDAKVAADAGSVETLLKGDELVVAIYSQKTGGAQLLCIQLREKKIKWETKLAGLQTEVNYNRLWLSLYQDYILLEGMEPSGRYLKAYHLLDGKRIYTN